MTIEVYIYEHRPPCPRHSTYTLAKILIHRLLDRMGRIRKTTKVPILKSWVLKHFTKAPENKTRRNATCVSTPM